MRRNSKVSHNSVNRISVVKYQEILHEPEISIHQCKPFDKLKIEFEQKATVCKYVVPKGYGLPADHPDAASSRAKIEIGNVGKARLYYSSVDKKEDGLYLSSSRAIGIVGIADTLDAARKIAEEGVKAVSGPVAYREDIGTNALIQKRIDHMKKIRKD